MQHYEKKAGWATDRVMAPKAGQIELYPNLLASQDEISSDNSKKSSKDGAMNSIEFKYGNELKLDEVIELYTASTLGDRRPIDDRRIMSDMIRYANLTVTAWDGELLVGIARTLTDFAYVGYLSDLAVRQSHQKKGIGIQLIDKTRAKMGPRSMLVLLAAPNAVEYYPKIGFSRHESAWVLTATDPFPKAVS